MTNEQRDIQRKLKGIQHAEKIGNAHKACRYFGVGGCVFGLEALNVVVILHKLHMRPLT